MKLVKTFNTITCILLCGIWFEACAPRSRPAASPILSAAPDYGSLDYWAAHPAKKDPSDSIPFPLLTDTMKDTTVDVFFIHPTSYTGKLDDGENALLSDKDLNEKTDHTSILYQASVFNKYNVYAPRYRQAHLSTYFTTDSVRAKRAFDMAYEDVKAAFEYYLVHENKGKPIIIASHSQGTTHAKRLLKEFFEGKELQKHLVAAYIIGMNIEPEYFTSLQPCKDSTQTGCFIGWRTFKRGYEPDFLHSSRSSIVINPLTWTTDTTYAPRSMHKGAILLRFNKLLPSVNDAQVYKDLLWISPPKFPGSRWVSRANYHIGDINLFYLNIRENLDQRVASYKKKMSE